MQRSLSFSLPALAARRRAPTAGAVFDFTTGVLPSGVTFARGSGALAYSTPSLAQDVGPNVPRFVVDPFAPASAALLVEPASTNVITHARPAPSTWVAEGASLTSLASATHGYFQGVSIASGGASWHRAMTPTTLIAGQTYVATVMLRVGTSGRARLSLRSPSGLESRIHGDIGNLIVYKEEAGPITSLTDEIHSDGQTRRIRFIVTPSETGSSAFRVGPHSTISGEDIEFLAAQLEPSQSASSLIDTDGTAQTRDADQPAIVGITGVFDVTVTLADGTTSVLPAQNVSDGYWPAVATGYVARIELA